MKHYKYEKIKESLWGVGCWMSPDNFTKLSCWEVSNIFCPFETCHWHPSPIRLRHPAQPRMETVKYKLVQVDIQKLWHHITVGWIWRHRIVHSWTWSDVTMLHRTFHRGPVWCMATPHHDTLGTVQELHELHFIGGTDINDIEEI